MYRKFQDFLKTEIQSIKDAGLYKTERLIATPQGAEIKLTTGETVLKPKKDSTPADTVCHQYASSVGPRTSTKSSKLKFPNSSARKTPFSMPLVSTLTAVFSNRYSARKMPSSPTN